jgi:hypothetical protein
VAWPPPVIRSTRCSTPGKVLSIGAHRSGGVMVMRQCSSMARNFWWLVRLRLATAAPGRGVLHEVWPNQQKMAEGRLSPARMVLAVAQ